jgi:hypothetical protein
MWNGGMFAALQHDSVYSRFPTMQAIIAAPRHIRGARLEAAPYHEHRRRH